MIQRSAVHFSPKTILGTSIAILSALIFFAGTPSRASSTQSFQVSEGSGKDDDLYLESALSDSSKTFSEIVSDAPEPPGPPFYLPSRHLKKLLKEIEPLKKKSAQNPKPVTACINGILKYQCEHSPYKDLNFSERYKEFERVVEARFKNQDTAIALADYRNAPACIAARETGKFEPIAISWLNCEQNTFVTDLGLGQVTLQTFLFTVGLDFLEVKETLDRYAGKSEDLRKKKKNSKTKKFYPVGTHLKLSTKRAEDLPHFTEVYPFNTDEYRRDPMRMYEETADSPEFQIDLLIAVLKSKIKRNTGINETLSLFKARSEDRKISSAKRNYWAAQLELNKAIFERRTFEFYNGGANRLKYGAAVYACKSCLDRGKEDALHCLGLAFGDKDFKGSKLCTE